MRPFLERIKSRKFIMSIIAAAIGFIKVYNPDFPDQALYTIVGSLMGYVVVQGIVDTGEQLALKRTPGELPVQPTGSPVVPDPRLSNIINQLNEVLLELQQMGTTRMQK